MRQTVPAALAMVAVASMSLAVAQRSDVFNASRDHEAIAYSTAPVRNAVTALNDQIQQKQRTLTFHPDNGYLRSVLDALSIPVESQVLAFGQNSLQGKHVSRENPRAIYFRDDVAVGWIRGADLLELVVQDPKQGAIFYTLRQSAEALPTFTRDDKCLACHLTWETKAVPGPFVQTVFPRRSDDEYANGFIVDHRVTLAERWGGWYVTGTRVPRSMGNQPLMQPKMAVTGPTPVDAPGPLNGAFEPRGYPHLESDVVALMVLEHQAHAANLITRAGWEHRIGSPLVRAAVEELVDYFLFVDEAPFVHPIKGSSGFTETFAALGPRDSKGRSLRDFDLQTRLMRYPLSYMIYSPGFAGLPTEVKAMVRSRLDEVLSGRETHKKYSHLDAPTRRAIAEILTHTLSAS
jgi:hypothetical protein